MYNKLSSKHHAVGVPNSNLINLIKCDMAITRFIIWLAPRAGKIKGILCSDWLPEPASWAFLARSGLPALVPQKQNSLGVIFWPYNKSFIDQACSVKMAGIGLVLFCVFVGLDFVSVHKNAKKNLANIQPS